MKELMPIGSVVLLKGAAKRVMIVGWIQHLDEDKRLYDYSACLYPEGITDPKQLYVFDNKDIESVFFIGFQDMEEIQFKEMLQKRGEELNWELI